MSRLEKGKMYKKKEEREREKRQRKLKDRRTERVEEMCERKYDFKLFLAGAKYEKMFM